MGGSSISGQPAPDWQTRINETLRRAVKRSARVNGLPPMSEHTMPRKTKPKLFSAADPENRRVDAADHLTTPELIEAYLDEAIATGYAAVIRQALSVVARARRRLAGKANASRRRGDRGSPGPETAG